MTEQDDSPQARQPDNPAERLHAILRAVKHDYPSSTVSRVAWGGALGTGSYYDDVIPALGRLIQLPARIEDLAEEHHLAPELFIDAWGINVRKTFDVAAQTLAGEIAAVQQTLSDQSLLALRFTSHLLHTTRQQWMPPVSDLQDIAHQLSELADEIARSDTPSEMKHYLLHLTDTMLAAIRSVKVDGTRTLQTGLETVVGASVLYKNDTEKASGTTFWSRFWEQCNRVNIVVSGTSAAIQIGAAALPQLPPGILGS